MEISEEIDDLFNDSVLQSPSPVAGSTPTPADHSYLSQPAEASTSSDMFSPPPSSRKKNNVKQTQ